MGVTSGSRAHSNVEEFEKITTDNSKTGNSIEISSVDEKVWLHLSSNHLMPLTFGHSAKSVRHFQDFDKQQISFAVYKSWLFESAQNSGHFLSGTLFRSFLLARILRRHVLSTEFLVNLVATRSSYFVVLFVIYFPDPASPVKEKTFEKEKSPFWRKRRFGAKPIIWRELQLHNIAFTSRSAAIFYYQLLRPCHSDKNQEVQSILIKPSWMLP